LRLKQGFGRLIRHREDRGIVAVLDRRITRKSYGRRFLGALPDAQRFHDLALLREWWGAS
jgi:ATP-dependent DNA helicase DinG